MRRSFEEYARRDVGSGRCAPDAVRPRGVAGALALASALAIGCAGAPTEEGERAATLAAPAPAEPVGEAGAALSAATVCLTLRRGGDGNAFDTMINEEPANAGSSYGATTLPQVGVVSGTRRHTLIKWDLSSISPTATVLNAGVTLNLSSTGAGTPRAHLITAPWAEGTVSWSSFAGAYNPAILTSFSNGFPASPAVSFSVLATAQAWVSGALPNEGILLEQAGPNQTRVKSSEWGVVSQRPTLNLCYKIPCGAGSADCDGNGVNGCEASLSSPDSCGACGVVCAPLPHAAAACAAGACGLGACDPGFANCDGIAANGCETPISTPGNCGGCGVVCDDGNACTADTCVALACAYPPAANGLGCDDGDACTQTDTCQAGVCVGGNPGGPGCAVAGPELCVANYGSSQISVFPASQSGDGAPIRSFGDRTKITSPVGAVFDPVHDEMILADAQSSALLVFDRGAGGNTPPKRVISGPSTGFDGNLRGITFDPVNDEIWVNGYGNSGSQFSAFPRLASGDVPPLRVIVPEMGGIQGDVGDVIHFDPTAGELLASGWQYSTSAWIFAYPRLGSGSTAPLRAFRDGGGDFHGTRIYGFDVDDVHGQIIVSTVQGLDIYPRGASGEAAKISTIACAQCNPGYIITWAGLAYDPVNDEVLFSLQGWGSANLSLVPRLGGVVRSLGGGDNVLFDNPRSMAIDGGRGEVFGFDWHPGLKAYARTDAAPAVGVWSTVVDAVPVRVLGGAASGVYHPAGLVADQGRDELFVVGSEISAVTVFSDAAAAQPSLLRTINGPSTHLNYPQQIAADLVHDELYVPSWSNIQVFSRTANGDAAPLRTLTSVYPAALAIDPVGDEIYVATYSTIDVYPRLINGDVPAPTRSWPIQDPGVWETPGQLVLDPAHGEIFVMMGGGDMGSSADAKVKVYPMNNNGVGAPIRTISGAVSGLASPGSMALDPVANLLVVSDASWQNESLFVFDRGAGAASLPLRIIHGPATALSQVRGVTFCQHVP